ncbi:MAG: single-stranded DNA-binding protein [Candidatus Omnitrophica bacterium]|nr:single-stranded DNA-binding protein [Candidatus Omnitrophota bacterium]
MVNLNRVFLIGNLVRDPELRYTPQGTAVVNLRLAINYRFRTRNGEDKTETCFVTVVVWNKQAETCNQYLKKGRLVFVEGRLQSRSFEDNTGKKRNVIEVRAERVQFLGTPTTPSLEDIKNEISDVSINESTSEQDWFEEGDSLDEK